MQHFFFSFPRGGRPLLHRKEKSEHMSKFRESNRDQLYANPSPDYDGTYSWNIDKQMGCVEGCA